MMRVAFLELGDRSYADVLRVAFLESGDRSCADVLRVEPLRLESDSSEESAGADVLRVALQLTPVLDVPRQVGLFVVSPCLF